MPKPKPTPRPRTASDEMPVIFLRLQPAFYTRCVEAAAKIQLKPTEWARMSLAHSLALADELSTKPATKPRKTRSVKRGQAKAK